MCAWNYDRTYAEEMRSASQVQSASSPGPGNDEHHLCVAVCRVSTLGASKVTFFVCFCFAFCLFHLPLTLHMIPIHIKVEVFKIFGFSVKKITQAWLYINPLSLFLCHCLSVHKIVTRRNSQFKKRLVLIYSGSHEWSQQRTIKRSPCWKSIVLLQVWKTWTGYIQECKTLTPRWNGDIMWRYFRTHMIENDVW